MRTAVLWGLLVLLSQHNLVSSHTAGRPSSTGDLVQLKSLLERFAESLAEDAEDDDSETDYPLANREPEQNHAGRGWSQEQDGDQEPLTLNRPQPATDIQKAANQKSRLLDLLIGARKRASGCFGARMDRIGNASGLGCNTGRG